MNWTPYHSPAADLATLELATYAAAVLECDAAAVLEKHATLAACWRVRLRLPGGEQIGTAHASPVLALAHAARWVEDIARHPVARAAVLGQD
jgi:hypothetical protein